MERHGLRCAITLLALCASLSLAGAERLHAKVVAKTITTTTRPAATEHNDLSAPVNAPVKGRLDQPGLSPELIYDLPLRSNGKTRDEAMPPPALAVARI